MRRARDRSRRFSSSHGITRARARAHENERKRQGRPAARALRQVESAPLADFDGARRRASDDNDDQLRRRTTRNAS